MKSITLVKESEAPTHIWVKRHSYDTLGVCLKLYEVKTSIFYYAKFEGSNTITHPVSRQTINNRKLIPNATWFKTQWDLKDHTIEAMTSHIAFVKTKEADGWYRGYDGVE